jgi:hypothetical protein
MHPKRLRMDLVDRDVDVLVIGVAVAYGDVLVLGEPEGIHQPFHDLLKLLSLKSPIVGATETTSHDASKPPRTCADVRVHECDLVARLHEIATVRSRDLAASPSSV